MIRWIGAIFVVFATSYAGYEYSQNLQKRIQQLNGLKKIFTDLYSDVEYGACTLLESFSRIGERQENLYRDFLQRVCSGMKKDEDPKEKNGIPFHLIFSEAIMTQLSESALTDSDRNSLIQLGKQLGNNQRNGQLRILQLYLQELEQEMKELEKTKQEKQKIGRILGVSSGVLIVILLL